MDVSTFETVVRLIVAAVLSGAIGYEREHHHKPAGIRTNMLVGIGTAAMAIVSLEIAKFSPDPAAVDVSRIASTILTGIGFIGAGTIIQSHGTVTGLTTAASIWVVAAIGLACGMGLYPLALATTIISLITLVVLRSVQVTEAEEEKERKSSKRSRKL